MLDQGPQSKASFSCLFVILDSVIFSNINIFLSVIFDSFKEFKKLI